jgi:hypothetical protein
VSHRWALRTFAAKPWTHWGKPRPRNDNAFLELLEGLLIIRAIKPHHEPLKRAFITDVESHMVDQATDEIRHVVMATSLRN